MTKRCRSPSPEQVRAWACFLPPAVRSGTSMPHGRQLLTTALIAISCAACAAEWRRARVPAARDVRGVALIVEGPAFERPAAARRVREAVEQASGRRVVMVDRETSADDDAMKNLVA